MMNKKLTLLLLVCVIALSACGPKRYGCGPRRYEVKVKQLPFFNSGNKKHPLVFENQVGVVYV